MNIDEQMDALVDRTLRDVPDEQLIAMTRAVAELFRKLRDEAKRRGVWDQLVKQADGNR